MRNRRILLESISLPLDTGRSMELFDSHLAAEPGPQEPPTVVPWEKSCKTVPCWALNAPTAAPWQCCTARSRITKIEFLEAPLKSFFARQQPQVSLRSYSHYSKKRIPKALQAWKNTFAPFKTTGWSISHQQPLQASCWGGKLQDSSSDERAAAILWGEK